MEDLSEITSALRDVDEYFQRSASRRGTRMGPGMRSATHLMKFEVRSPAILQILCDPAWLAVFIALLAGYDKLADNAGRILDDIGRVCRRIKGLTDEQQSQLADAVRHVRESFEPEPPTAIFHPKRKYYNVRKRLMPDGTEEPAITIKDIRLD